MRYSSHFYRDRKVGRGGPIKNLGKPHILTTYNKTDTGLAQHHIDMKMIKNTFHVSN